MLGYPQLPGSATETRDGISGGLGGVHPLYGVFMEEPVATPIQWSNSRCREGLIGSIERAVDKNAV